MIASSAWVILLCGMAFFAGAIVGDIVRQRSERRLRNINPPPSGPRPMAPTTRPPAPDQPVIPQPLPFSRRQHADRPESAASEYLRRAHRIALKASIEAIESMCIFSHNDPAFITPWYACPPTTAADIAEEMGYLSLYGLIDVIHGDVQLIRIKKELLT